MLVVKHMHFHFGTLADEAGNMVTFCLFFFVDVKYKDFRMGTEEDKDRNEVGVWCLGMEECYLFPNPTQLTFHGYPSCRSFSNPGGGFSQSSMISTSSLRERFFVKVPGYWGSGRGIEGKSIRVRSGKCIQMVSCMR